MVPSYTVGTLEITCQTIEEFQELINAINEYSKGFKEVLKVPPPPPPPPRPLTLEELHKNAKYHIVTGEPIIDKTETNE